MEEQFVWILFLGVVAVAVFIISELSGKKESEQGKEEES